MWPRISWAWRTSTWEHGRAIWEANDRAFRDHVGYTPQTETDYEWWRNFYEFHKLAIDELEAFDYETYKKNGFRLEHLGDYDLKLETKPE